MKHLQACLSALALCLCTTAAHATSYFELDFTSTFSGEFGAAGLPNHSPFTSSIELHQQVDFDALASGDPVALGPGQFSIPIIYSYGPTGPRYISELITLTGTFSQAHKQLALYAGSGQPAMLFTFDLAGFAADPDHATVAQTTPASLVLPFSAGGGAIALNQANGTLTASVPEPRLWLTMVTGFGIVGALARRRQRRAPA